VDVSNSYIEINGIMPICLTVESEPAAHIQAPAGIQLGKQKLFTSIQ
jgi:hypothetical protein